MTDAHTEDGVTWGRRASRAGLRAAPWLAVLLVAAAVARFKLLAPLPARVARVERGPIVEEAFGRGTVESRREAALGFDLVGRVSEVLVEEGARVTLGQELARLETTQSQAELRSAQLNVSAARASLKRLAADEERARTLLTAAQREAARAQALFDAGTLPAQQRDDTADRVRLARAELDRVLAQRSEAMRGVDVASGGAEQRRATLVRATLLAPFDGVVTRRLREPGDTVAVGSTVLRVADTTRVRVLAALDETVLPRLEPDQPALILFPGAPDRTAGKVVLIPWEADRQTHEIAVEVEPERLERRVAIGQRADVRVELRRIPDALRVPIDQLFHDAAGVFVHVDRSGRVAVVRPELGARGSDYVEVRAGLGEGDVVLAPARAGVTLTPGRPWRQE